MKTLEKKLASASVLEDVSGSELDGTTQAAMKLLMRDTINLDTVVESGCSCASSDDNPH